MPCEKCQSNLAMDNSQFCPECQPTNTLSLEELLEPDTLAELYDEYAEEQNEQEIESE